MLFEDRPTRPIAFVDGVSTGSQQPRFEAMPPAALSGTVMNNRGFCQSPFRKTITGRHRKPGVSGKTDAVTQ
jgi:hypothetical protein